MHLVGLFSMGRTTYLIDMDGFVVKTWVFSQFGDSELLENGNLLRIETVSPQVSPLNWGGTYGMLKEVDWNGNVKWEYKIDTVDALSHHTFRRMPNGNTLVLVWERHTYDEAVAAGRKADTLNDPDASNCTNPNTGRYNCDFWPDVIYEISKTQGVVWKWDAWDHIKNGKYADSLDINYRFPTPKPDHRGTADYMHCNSVDYQDGKIVLNSRAFGEFYIIDYATKEIFFRWGNPPAWDATKKSPSYMNDGDQVLFGPHASHFIRPGLPGTGNVLVFDNGWRRPNGQRSRVLEVNPTTGAIIWQYETIAPIFSEFQGSVQRLPNGNTLITYSGQGHLLEVTPDKEIVWEYVSPYSVNAATGDNEVKCLQSEAQYGANAFFRAIRYSPDYPGLKGKKLQRLKYLNQDCLVIPYLIPPYSSDK
jgi:hypothetical protein